MAHTINNRSKRMLDILVESNVDISKLSILRKTAADWTREQAEAKLDPNSSIEAGGYDPGSVYTLGTFFTNPMAGGTPAYQLYPDLGLAAAKRLLKLREESPNGSALFTILKYKINEKVPEVAQDIVNVLIDSGDTFNYFGHNFHKTNPEALEPLMLSLLKRTPSNYFYIKKSSRGKTDPGSEMVNKISFPEEERVIIGDLIEGLEGKKPKHGSTAYNILMEHDGWMSNPEAAKPFMQASIDWIGSGGGKAGKYMKAYPEETAKALREWAERDPSGFVKSNSAIYDLEALKIALSALAKENPTDFFHTMAFRGKKDREIFYNESINHKENIANAIDKQMNKDSSESGPYGSGPDYFLTSSVWSDALEAVGVRQEISGKSVKDYAMNKLLEEADSLSATFADPNYDPDPDKSGRFKSIVERIFGWRPNHEINIVNRFKEYLDHPTVKRLAEFYARNNLIQFFDADIKLYDHFPEAAKNNMLKYIKFEPLNYFKRDIHKTFPDFIDVALAYFRSKLSSEQEDESALRSGRRGVRNRLFEYFQWGLDDLDSEDKKNRMAMKAFSQDLQKSIEDGIAAKHPNALLAFLKNIKEEDLENIHNPGKFFRKNIPGVLSALSDENNEDKIDEIISMFAYSLAKKRPLFFFTNQLNGEKIFYYELLINKNEYINVTDKDLELAGKQEYDEELIIANLYPHFRETALEAFLKKGQISNFYEAIKNYNIELSLEDQKYLLKVFIYGEEAESSSGNLKTSHGNPPLNAAKLFKYMKDVNDYSLKDKFPDFIREVAENFAFADSKNFDKYEVNKLYPDIKYKKISSLRQIENKENAINHFNGTTNALVGSDLPNHIKINSSMYQDDQRPDEWVGSERFTISQNNTNPNDLLYNINKKLIHAGDGVAHTNVGASGFTSAWALAAVHGPISKRFSYVSSSDHSGNLRVLEAVEDLKQYFWQLSKEDKNEEVLSILKEKNVENYLADEAAINVFHKILQSPVVGSREEPMGFEPVEAGLAKVDIRDMIEMIDEKIGIPDYKIGGLVYIVLRNFDSIKAWNIEHQPEWLVKVLADSFRSIINLESNYEEDEEEDAEDFPEETLVIEQYQSDYPVVYDRIFLGNLRNEDGSLKGKDYDQLNNMIKEHLDKDLAKRWIEENGLSDQWKEFLIDYQALEGTEQVQNDLLGTFFESMTNDLTIPIARSFELAKETRFPIEIAPEVKDARRHFDIISKVYPYLILINTIEVAKRLGHKYIYILKNAPFYASIQNAEKATKLYKNIPELVATTRSINRDLYVSNKTGTSGYDEEHLELVYEIPANEESIAVLRSAAQKLSGKNNQYDFSLTPSQNKANRILPEKKDRTWNPTPEKIQRLKELTDIVKTELSGVDVPDFYDPVGAIKYLTKEVRSKIIPKKRFSRVFGPIIGELGKLSRASRLERLINEMFIKTSSETSSRRKALRKFLILNAMNAATN